MHPTSRTDGVDMISLLEGDHLAYTQADHFADLAALFGEGAVMIYRPGGDDIE